MAGMLIFIARLRVLRDEKRTRAFLGAFTGCRAPNRITPNAVAHLPRTRSETTMGYKFRLFAVTKGTVPPFCINRKMQLGRVASRLAGKRRSGTFSDLCFTNMRDRSHPFRSERYQNVVCQTSFRTAATNYINPDIYGLRSLNIKIA